MRDAFPYSCSKNKIQSCVALKSAFFAPNSHILTGKLADNVACLGVSPVVRLERCFAAICLLVNPFHKREILAHHFKKWPLEKK